MLLDCKGDVWNNATCFCQEKPYLTLIVNCHKPSSDQIRKCFMKYNQTEKLEFRNSDLDNIPSELSILKKIKDVDFSNNNITELDFKHLTYICSRIETLNLDFNNIVTLKNGTLDCFSNLRTLSISNNSLRYIENNAFNKKLQNFSRLYAQYNDLTLLDTSVYSMLTHNSHISANVSYNRISHFTNSANFSVDDLDATKSLAVLAIHNNITRLNLTDFYQLFHVTSIEQIYKLWNCNFDFRFNPLICDCEMFWMAKMIKLFRPMDPNNPIFSLTCNTPLSLYGRTLYSVPENEFNCTVTERCPIGCSCTKTTSLHLLTIFCDSNYTERTLPKELPYSDKIHVNIKGSALTNLEKRSYLKNVTILDISQNSITSTDQKIVPQWNMIKKVFLHDNLISYMPKEVMALNFTRLMVLTLHGNPFKCDCHSLWFKNWLIKHQNNIPRLDKILCTNGPGSGKLVVNAKDTDFICTGSLTTAEIVAILLGVTCITFIIAGVIRAKWTQIQILLIAHLDIHLFRKKVRTDLKYDIFVSHSSLDDDVVFNNIIPKLENNDPPFVLCRDDRDFSVGRTIAFNIISNIESSLSTLLVISNNFLRSDWCKMEFKQAHLKLLTEKRSNLIMIVLEDLDTYLMDKEIKHYVRTHVYLNFNDKYFWPKLLQALPVRRQLEPSPKRNHNAINGNMYKPANGRDERTSLLIN